MANDSDLPWDRLTKADKPARRKGEVEGDGLSSDELKLLEMFAKQAEDLGLDLSDPRVKDLLKRVGNVEGELSEDQIDEIVSEQELERNLHTSEVIVDGIEDSTFAAMLNTRIEGDEDSLVRLKAKTQEELRIMLVEALARDIPVQLPDKTQAEYEEAILNVILDKYGTFDLKQTGGGNGGGGSKNGLDLAWVRSWGLPGFCLLLVLAYTAYMFYHHPESYTDYEKYVQDQKIARQSRANLQERDEL